MSEDKQNGAMPAGHMERYHPHGIKEGDTCKYLDGGLASHESPSGNPSINKREPSQGEIPPYKGIKKIEQEISNLCGAKCYFAESDLNLYRIFGADVGSANILSILGKPVSRETYEQNIRAFLQAIKHIKGIAPHFNLNKAKIIPWNMFQTKKWYAHSSLDCRKDVITRLITLGPIFDAPISEYGDKDSHSQHIIRHEIGHNLSSDVVCALFRLMRSNLSPEKKEKFNKGILKLDYIGARRDEEEAIAEIFALYTDPLYKKGTMPKGFENLAETMLGNNPSLKGVTMDKGISDKDMLKIHPLYLWRVETTETPPDEKYSWYDARAAKYISFKTGAEMLRYALPIFQIRQENVERIINAHPNREWDSWDISCIVNSWLYLHKSIDEIIAEVEENGLFLRR